MSNTHITTVWTRFTSLISSSKHLRWKFTSNFSNHTLNVITFSPVTYRHVERMTVSRLLSFFLDTFLSSLFFGNVILHLYSIRDKHAGNTLPIFCGNFSHIFYLSSLFGVALPLHVLNIKRICTWLCEVVLLCEVKDDCIHRPFL